MIHRSPAVVAALLAATLAVPGVRAQERTPVVHALLFYSPTCPHCEELINNRLPPLLERYGSKLDVIGINVATQGGLRLYQAAASWYMIGPDRQGVPTLIVGSRVLVGEVEIPAVLPVITDSALARGGIDWPEAPEIRQALRARGLIDVSPAPPPPDSAPRDSVARQDSVAGPDSTSAPRADSATPAVPAREPPADSAARAGAPPASAPAPAHERVEAPTDTLATGTAEPSVADTVVADTAAIRPGLPRELIADATPLTMADRFRLDPVGNGAAVAVLFVLTGILALAGFGMGARARPPLPPSWLVPLLALAGMGIATYLSFIEVTGAEAVCGPVGDCNTVQQSEYARLFGVLPVGVLGLAGYAAILLSWLISRRPVDAPGRRAALAAWAMAAVATLFSVYLTFLEPFVIGATCAWCLTSAVIAGLLLLATTPAAAQALGAGRANAGSPRKPERVP